MQLLPIEVLGFSPNAESSLAYKQISLSHSSHWSNIRKRRRSTKGLVLPFPDLASACKSNEKHLFRWVLPLFRAAVWGWGRPRGAWVSRRICWWAAARGREAGLAMQLRKVMLLAKDWGWWVLFIFGSDATMYCMMSNIRSKDINR